MKEEAVVDSGAVECVASRIRVPHLRVEETLQSIRGEIWTCAGEKEIKEEGKSRARLDDGSCMLKSGVLSMGSVSRTWISVDRLLET